MKVAISTLEKAAFLQMVSTRLTPEQMIRVTSPPQIFTGQKAVLAVHWHPEYIPLELIAQRLERLYPDAQQQLIIPTQHNVLVALGRFAGVEIDCYSRRFNQKVQLLLHFAGHRVAQAATLKSMLVHTFNYRINQLHAFIEAVLRPDRAIAEEAAFQTGADTQLIRFVTEVVQKVAWLLETTAATVPPEMIKNKLLRNFMEGQRPYCDDLLINRAQRFLAAVKHLVKRRFPPEYFYRTSEVIEEARGLGAGIVVPHPEQFWPILLADYDVDGYEVWNPQSHQYTGFLIDVLHRQNRRRSVDQRKLLPFMGDDTHLSEKLPEPQHQIVEKARREIGHQPAWDDIGVRNALTAAGMTRESVIQEYYNRLH